MSANRVIKFRVWDKEYKDWIEDGFSAITSEGNILCLRSGGLIGGWLEEYNQNNFIIQEFTGLKDKNGIEIFEGDIIQYNQKSSYDGVNFTVKWCDIMFGWVFRAKSGDYLVNERTPNGNRYDFIEVIGNIYENPGLLK